MHPIPVSLPMLDQESHAIESGMGMPETLGTRLIQAVASAGLQAGQQHAAIMAAASQPQALTSPDGLLKLQGDLGRYVNELNLASTLARKTVGCVETLVKAQ